mmetsp:Transcript_40919/g.98684  ORF Transcript_40919/g.98684 Transcript_40919/m.98684 type:complete len:103 (+) Transcript_40919:966-1274(+)
MIAIAPKKKVVLLVTILHKETAIKSFMNCAKNWAGWKICWPFKIPCPKRVGLYWLPNNNNNRDAWKYELVMIQECSSLLAKKWQLYKMTARYDTEFDCKLAA